MTVNAYVLDKKATTGIATLGEYYKIGNKKTGNFKYSNIILADDDFLYYTNSYFLIKTPCENVPNGYYEVLSQTAKELVLLKSDIVIRNELSNIINKLNNAVFFSDFETSETESPIDIGIIFAGYCFYKKLYSIHELRFFNEIFLKPLFKENINWQIGMVSADQLVFSYGNSVVTIMAIHKCDNYFENVVAPLYD